MIEKTTALYTDYYELAMAQGYFACGMSENHACFDYFFRKQPFGGGFVIFAGLQDLLDALNELQFSKEDIDYLEALGFDKVFLKSIKDFHFRGTITSVEEGEVVFANEPILHIEGTILETQIVETLVLNLLNFESLIATKASRMRLSAGNRLLVDFGLRRAQGYGGIHASRAAVVGGVDTTSNIFSAREFDLKPTGTMAHSWITCFENEAEAFRTFVKLYPETAILLVDTFDTLRSGIPNAITIAHEMHGQGQKLKGIRLDSGDLAYLSKRARAMLDKEGLRDTLIFASNQLDEHIIKSLLEQGAPIDGFGVGTSLVTGQPDAALDGVYKLASYDGKPKLKKSENIEKLTLPGLKKLHRFLDRDGAFFADAIFAADEDVPEGMVHPLQPGKRLDLRNMRNEPLMQIVMEKGKATSPRRDPYAIADGVKMRLEKLPQEHKRFENPHVYKVGISEKLMHLRNQLAELR